MQHPPLEQDDTTHVQHTLPPEATRVGERSEGVLTVLRGPNAGSLHTLESSHVILGRSGEAHVLLTDSALSRRHACIARKPDGFYLQDLGSTNGTRVDGRPAEQPVLLHDGARIEMGALTGAYNRRHVEHRLQSELAFARRHGTALCALLIDVDHFKHVNDGHGHDAGDLALRVIARALDRMLRIEDVVGRWGSARFRDEYAGRATAAASRSIGIASKNRRPCVAGQAQAHLCRSSARSLVPGRSHQKRSDFDRLIVGLALTRDS